MYPVLLFATEPYIVQTDCYNGISVIIRALGLNLEKLNLIVAKLNIARKGRVCHEYSSAIGAKTIVNNRHFLNQITIILYISIF